MKGLSPRRIRIRLLKMRHVRRLRSYLQARMDDWVKTDKAKRVRKIVKKYNTQLTKAAMSRVSEGATLASSLYNENYIHDRYFLEMVKTVNRAEPELDMVYASTIISAIRRIVYEDPDAFPAILTILKRHEAIDVVAIKMEKEYYDDEDVCIKLSVFILAGVAVVLVFLAVVFLIFWNYSYSPTECLKITQEVRQKISLNLTSLLNDIDKEHTQKSSCKELFEHLSLPYEEYMTECNGSAPEQESNMCVGELVFKELESLERFCINDLVPVFECLGMSLNITELEHRLLIAEGTADNATTEKRTASEL